MNFDNAARARIARGWLNSSLDQNTYAAKHGVSSRTLRQWVTRYGAGRPQAQLRAAIVASIEQLQNVLVALDAEAATDSAALADATRTSRRR
jgi:transposase-like protein